MHIKTRTKGLIVNINGHAILVTAPYTKFGSVTATEPRPWRVARLADWNCSFKQFIFDYFKFRRRDRPNFFTCSLVNVADQAASGLYYLQSCQRGSGRRFRRSSSRLCGRRFCRRRGHGQGLGCRRWPRIASGCRRPYIGHGATTMANGRSAALRRLVLKRVVLDRRRELGAASSTARSRLPNGRGYPNNGLQALRDRRERRRIARTLQGLRDEARPSVEPLRRHRICQVLGACGQLVLPRRHGGTHGGVAQRRDDLIIRVAVKEVIREGVCIQQAALRPGGHRLGQARQQPGPQLGLRLGSRGPFQGAERAMDDRRQPCREAIGCRRWGFLLVAFRRTLPQRRRFVQSTRRKNVFQVSMGLLSCSSQVLVSPLF
jgi:hypothetical protein